MKCKEKFPDCGMPLKTICQCCEYIRQLEVELKMKDIEIKKLNESQNE